MASHDRGRELLSPFVAVPVSEKQMGGIAKSARGMNWSFRRAGLLTARLTERGSAHTLHSLERNRWEPSDCQSKRVCGPL